VFSRTLIGQNGAFGVRDDVVRVLSVSPRPEKEMPDQVGHDEDGKLARRSERSAGGLREGLVERSVFLFASARSKEGSERASGRARQAERPGRAAESYCSWKI